MDRGQSFPTFGTLGEGPAALDVVWVSVCVAVVTRAETGRLPTRSVEPGWDAMFCCCSEFGTAKMYSGNGEGELRVWGECGQFLDLSSNNSANKPKRVRKQGYWVRWPSTRNATPTWWRGFWVEINPASDWFFFFLHFFPQVVEIDPCNSPRNQSNCNIPEMKMSAILSVKIEAVLWHI